MNAGLAPLVEQLAAARVLCVGDVMLDRFVHGDVSRVSPEAPIPVLRARGDTTYLGGAGNVVRNLLALGAGVSVVGVVGDDAAGDEVRALIAGNPRVDARLCVAPGRETSVKTRFLAAGQQILRVDHETTADLDAGTRAAVLAAFAGGLDACAVVVMSDYGKGVLADGLAEEMIGLAAKAGRPVFVDPKGADYGRYRGAAVVTPNLRELAEAARLPVDGPGDADAAVAAAARHLIDTCGLGAVLATRSRDGMTLVRDGEDAVHHHAQAREVYDVSGAGDTVIATLAAAVAAGAGLVDAMGLANAAAGIVVGKVGTAVVHPAELAEALHHQDLSGAEAKVLTLDAAEERVALWRRKGRSVGFTNGCFDLLHPGHVSLIAQAAAQCDHLIVGLNGDGSVRRLKGPGRPVQSESARATVLASLADVDMVVVFHEDTPLRLIETLRPDVLVKGADYTVAQVVGGNLVTGYGGRVVLAELAEGHSTTGTIRRMDRRANGEPDPT
ncbi:MAG: D-glycero-beta-D-manno-heptose-7-phosphate kinase [Hyphomicrobiales bacterium]|nr:D-glycero-beta-D-manno-heptose-7-phosphate kinase [Hyphomicrobiales bacterium]